MKYLADFDKSVEFSLQRRTIRVRDEANTHTHNIFARSTSLNGSMECFLSKVGNSPNESDVTMTTAGGCMFRMGKLIGSNTKDGNVIVTITVNGWGKATIDLPAGQKLSGKMPTNFGDCTIVFTTSQGEKAVILTYKQSSGNPETDIQAFPNQMQITFSEEQLLCLLGYIHLLKVAMDRQKMAVAAGQ